MPPKKTSTPASHNTNISVGGDVDGNIIVGDNNTVNQTIIQKFFNIFKSDAETVDQRNRRIMLGHVENFWVKGILEKSLHGAALLDLGIKEDPDALNYPWAIKREANKETLPAGTSMLEIFQEIGMGRSLLILGAPGSGKTTMLLELTRQLIEHAREDVTEPIPVVFNLSSWTEEISLADWLARELNVIYTIPKKVAPTWIKENKMLLLLDGLDEVKKESRDKCVDAINQFRKENGLTSMAVCSRIQDYGELNARLSFDGAIEIQPLASNQVDEYFERFGKGMAGFRQAFEKDFVLREMAETPLFLSIMTLAYRDIQSQDILISENLDAQRKHLFDTYIERMFERPERSKNKQYKRQDIQHWLSWLASKIIKHNLVPYNIEEMQPDWLKDKNQILLHKIFTGVSIGLAVGLSVAPFGLFGGMGVFGLLFSSLTFGVCSGLLSSLGEEAEKIKIIDTVSWSWKKAISYLISGLVVGLGIGMSLWLSGQRNSALTNALEGLLILGLAVGLPYGLLGGLSARQMAEIKMSGQRLHLSASTAVLIFFCTFLFITVSIGFLFGFSGWQLGGLNFGLSLGLLVGPLVGLIAGWFGGLNYGGLAVVRHYYLRALMNRNDNIPFRLVPFLDYCADLIFLRRVGGGYIFVHRLLMEHFAAMYPEEA